MRAVKVTTRCTTTSQDDILKVLDEKLKHVNGRAHAHTLDAKWVHSVALASEKRLTNGGVTQKSLVGTIVTYMPGGPGNAYARVANHFTTTRVTLRRATDGWRLIDAEKLSRRADSGNVWGLEISEQAEADMLRLTFRNIVIRDAA